MTTAEKIGMILSPLLQAIVSWRERQDELNQRRAEVESLRAIQRAQLNQQIQEERNRQEEAERKAIAFQNAVNRSREIVNQMEIGGERTDIPPMGIFPFLFPQRIERPYTKEKLGGLLNELITLGVTGGIGADFVKRGEDIIKERFPEATEEFGGWGRTPEGQPYAKWTTEGKMTRLQPFSYAPDIGRKGKEELKKGNILNVLAEESENVKKAQTYYSESPSEASLQSFYNTHSLAMDRIKKQLEIDYPNVLDWYNESYDALTKDLPIGKSPTWEEWKTELDGEYKKGNLTKPEYMVAKQLIDLDKTTIDKGLMLRRKLTPTAPELGDKITKQLIESYKNRIK